MKGARSMPNQVTRSCVFGFGRRLMVAGAGLMVGGVMAVGSGCSSTPKPTVASTAERAAAVPPQVEAFDRLGYRLQYRTFATVLPGERVEFFAPLGDVLVTQDSGSVVSVIEVRTGERKWVDQVGSPLITFFGAIRDGDRLIVSSEAEAFFFDVNTGAVLDKQKMTEVVTTPPVQIGDILVYGTATKVVNGHSMLARFRLWGALMDAPTETPPVMVGDGGVVGLVSRRGDVAFVDGSSGLAIGRNSMFGGAVGTPASSDGAMFVASRDHSLWAFAADGASQLWRYRTDAPLEHAPTYANGRVYCDLGREGMSAFDSASGRKLWSTPDVRGRIVAVRGGRLLAYDGRNAALLDASDGSVIERATLEKIAILVPDKLVDGTLYAVSENGVIARLTPRP